KCQDPHPGFTPEECDKVRLQLFDEVQAGHRVRNYFRPLGLQRPFRSAAAPGLPKIAPISDQTPPAVRPPPAGNATSKARTLTSYVGRVGSSLPPPVGAVAGTIGGGFALAGYLTKKDDAPNLIGPQVQTEASNLGLDLTTRYQTATAQFELLGQ